MRTRKLHALALVLVIGCGSTEARIKSAYDEPTDESYWAWMVDREYQAREGEISEAELVRMVDDGLRKWPESWELHAVKASSMVRQGRAGEAAQWHERATDLYYRDPYCGEPYGTHMANQGMAFAGSILLLPAIAINSAVTDDVVIGYPPEAMEETWIPSFWRDSYLCSDDYDRAEIAALAAEARARAPAEWGDGDGETKESEPATKVAAPHEEQIAPKPVGADERPSSIERVAGSTADDLEKLAELHESGALSDAEFQKAKAKLLE